MLSVEVAILKRRALNPYKKSEGLPRREAQLIEVEGKRETGEAIQRLQQAPATNHAQRHAMGGGDDPGAMALYKGSRGMEAASTPQ
jgi:hypothetical protein